MSDDPVERAARAIAPWAWNDVGHDAEQCRIGRIQSLIQARAAIASLPWDEIVKRVQARVEAFYGSDGHSEALPIGIRDAIAAALMPSASRSMSCAAGESEAK